MFAEMWTAPLLRRAVVAAVPPRVPTPPFQRQTTGPPGEAARGPSTPNIRSPSQTTRTRTLTSSTRRTSARCRPLSPMCRNHRHRHHHQRHRRRGRSRQTPAGLAAPTRTWRGTSRTSSTIGPSTPEWPRRP